MSKNVILIYFGDSIHEKCKYLSFPHAFQVFSTHLIGLTLILVALYKVTIRNKRRKQLLKGS